jgi:hypothetical protein
MPRYCQHIPDEFKASYASVLVHGPDPATLRLREAVHDRITSCFTTWCPDCSGTYMLTTKKLDSFPCQSAHHMHQLLRLSILRDSELGAFLVFTAPGP